MELTRKQKSRVLRQNQTPWEIKLWRVLKNKGINNLKFRRQYPIGRYIVDFYCPTKKLIIELEGGHHNAENQENKDKTRQKYLENQGYKVLRFWNNEIDDNLEGVVEQILNSQSPHPNPPRKRGGEINQIN